MSKNSEAVKRWRQNAKQRLIRAFSGSCCICGYNKCDEALEFHHTDPLTKETTWSAFRGSIKGWSTILIEMRKCVMLCSNCHKEVHAGVVQVPNNAPRLDEELADYKTNERAQHYDVCPVCSKEKRKGHRTCSKACAASRRLRIDWSKHDLLALHAKHKSYEAIGDALGVSGAAISRRMKILV